MRTTVSQKKRPFKFYATNILGNFIPSRPTLSEQYILDTARTSTGLQDWGSDTFLEGMRVLLDSSLKEARLHYFGRTFLQKGCIRAVKDRLRLSKAVKNNPDILNTPIEKPLFILGLPRTGTTLLQNLFFQEVRFRHLHFWEQLAIGPQPTPDNLHDNYIIDSGSVFINKLKNIAPEFFIAHEIQPRGPEECNGLMERDFSSIIYIMLRNIPTYTEWFQKRNMTSTYEYHRYQLQYLGYHFKGKRWVLKAPVHLLFLRYLFEVYPDARIIQLHRDPLKVIPSMCSLVAMSRAIHSNHVNITETAKQLLELMSININRSIAFRDSISPGQILDISFTELVENTMETMNRIYTWLMDDLRPETETAMSNWLHQSRMKRSGKPHKYSLDQFGFNDTQIQDCFAQYYERYADYL
jgi:hypothetical protein